MSDDASFCLERQKQLLADIESRPLDELMPLTGGVITMMFADIVNSSGIQAALGDEDFHGEIVEPHSHRLRECVAAYRGRELKTIGRSFFIAFSDPGDAVACAVQIQRRLRSLPIPAGSDRLQVRIGLHTGAPFVYRHPNSTKTDLFGKEVDKAVRVEALAGGGQVLLSGETQALAKPEQVYDWGIWGLKGLGPQQIFEVLWDDKPAQHPSGRRHLQRPQLLTPFVGRKDEIGEASTAVLSHRLVTLLGSGGIGKTRLADEVATRLYQCFDEEVFIVGLETTPESDVEFISTLTAAIGVNVAGFPSEAAALEAALANRKALVVLHNFETAPCAASVVANLLKCCGNVHFLITSRRPLGLEGENWIDVPPMKLPALKTAASGVSLASFDSFQLFSATAKSKTAGWKIETKEEAALVAEILDLTDGIPLCIELAAARVTSSSLTAIRTGLQKSRRNWLPQAHPDPKARRYVSLAACIDWTLRLLRPEEQTLFPKLSIFEDGFFAEDVAAVCRVDCDQVRSALDSLQDACLLARDDSLEKPRYRILPAVRKRAKHLLGGQASSLRRLHAYHFLRVLDMADNQIRGDQQKLGLARIAADLENILAGMEYASSTQDHRIVLRYSQAFAIYLRIKGRLSEYLTRCQQGLAAAETWNDARQTAACQNNLGNAYRYLSTGDRGANLLQAITYYEAALRVRTEREYPMQWATTQNNLGMAYAYLPIGDRAANLRHAIACYQAALRVRTERDCPADWAVTQNNLGNVYRNLPTGDRASNLQQAIACYEAALRVRTERDHPADWAVTQDNLGNAYRNLRTGDRGANFQQAIFCYEAALRVRTEEDYPVQWATTQHNLAMAYRNLPTGDRAANLQKAIACYEAALRVYTERDFPIDWATTQNNLGNAYGDLPAGDREANLVKAISCYQAALRVRTERDFPVQWAATQNNLGTAYGDLPSGDRSAILTNAIACYQAALRVYNEHDFPNDWAMTQGNLGTAYRNLPSGDRGANLLKAIACYGASLCVYTEFDFPIDWAMTQNNLGNAYGDLLTGNRSANLLKSITRFEAALRVFTEADFPFDWAMIQNRLGGIYWELPAGDRRANLRKATASYEAAIRGFESLGLTEEAAKVGLLLAQVKTAP